MKRLIFCSIIILNCINANAQKLFGKVENIKITRDTSQLLVYNSPQANFLKDGILYQKPDNMPCIISHPKSNMPCMAKHFFSTMPILGFPGLNPFYKKEKDRLQLQPRK